MVRAGVTLGRDGSAVRAEARMRLGRSKTAIRVGRASRSALGSGLVRLAIPLDRRARAQLRRAGRIRITLVLVATDGSGHKVTITRAVTVRRAAR
jgi:hypothetical protein